MRREVRAADQDHVRDALGMLGGVDHRRARAERMADQHDLAQAPSRGQGLDVGGVVFGAVAARRLARVAVAALVWGQHAELGRELLRDTLPDAAVVARGVQTDQGGAAAGPFPVVHVEAIDRQASAQRLRRRRHGRGRCARGHAPEGSARACEQVSWLFKVR